MSTTSEILVILLLVLANGLFAMSEMAVVSARKTRLQHLANQGDLRAKAALDLANSPNRFLSTVQIGITLVGILAGAFGGATLSQSIADLLNQIPAIAPFSSTLSLLFVVLLITYLSLVVGELVPNIEAVQVKEAFGTAAARSLRPEEAVRLIREGTARAIRRRGEIKPAPVKLPVRFEISYTDPSLALMADQIPTVDRTGSHTVAFVADDYLEGYRFVRVLYKFIQ